MNSSPELLQKTKLKDELFRLEQKFLKLNMQEAHILAGLGQTRSFIEKCKNDIRACQVKLRRIEVECNERT